MYSVVALAKKMVKPEMKNVICAIALPTTKIVKQPTQQQMTPKDTVLKHTLWDSRIWEF